MTVQGVREGLGSGELPDLCGLRPRLPSRVIPEGKELPAGAAARAGSGKWSRIRRWGHGTALCPKTAATLQSWANRAGRREAKAQSQPEHSPSSPLGWAPAPGIRQQLMFREGLPGSVHPSCPTVAVSLMSLVPWGAPRGAGGTAAPGQQPELPPLPLSTLSTPWVHSLPRGAAEAPGRVGSDTGVAVGWGQHRHPSTAAAVGEQALPRAPLATPGDLFSPQPCQPCS